MRFIYIIIGIAAFLFSFLFIPLNEEVEALFKPYILQVIMLPVIAFVVKFVFPVLNDKKWKPFYWIVFTVSFFSGLSLVVNYIFKNRISYLGIESMIFSLFFLILTLKFQRKK